MYCMPEREPTKHLSFQLWRGRKRTLLSVLFGVMLLTAFYVYRQYLAEPRGGEIYLPDLQSGVKIYIEESYSSTADLHDGVVDSLHAIYLVSDETLETELLDLCGSIRQYRQMDIVSDVMLGLPETWEYCPRLYLVTDAICYRIEPLNWENYSGNAWSGFPLKREAFGKPMLHVFRIDLSLMPEDEMPYRFAKKYNSSDSVNSVGGYGWYSKLPQESMDVLLNLLQNAGEEHAVKVETLGQAA